MKGRLKMSEDRKYRIVLKKVPVEMALELTKMISGQGNSLSTQQCKGNRCNLILSLRELTTSEETLRWLEERGFRPGVKEVKLQI